MIKTLKQHQFLFRELVKRDFRQKYRISGVDADF